jgi:DNA-binding beta-propeller fold protein YncE
MLLFAVALFEAAPALADTVVQSFGTEADPRAVVVNPVTNKSYVANLTSRLVSDGDSAIGR